MWANASSFAADAAVLDIGSNSVRLVIYRTEGRAVWTVFNEKVLAGLGKGVKTTGHLSPEGIVESLQALKRFKAVLDAIRPNRIYSAATAAVRDATDGRDFIARVESETGLQIRILTGPEEAHYAAQGVIAGHPDAEGVVGDLGGLSLELIRLSHGRVQGGVTLPLGPFSLATQTQFDPIGLREQIRSELIGKAKGFATRELHAVGGAWRNMALIWMHLNAYPLKVVHQFELTAVQARDLAHLVVNSNRTSLEKIPGLSKKRLETLPYSALVLEGLADELPFEKVVFSAFGLREGLLFEDMPSVIRNLDPLIEGYGALGGRQGMAEGLGPILAEWLMDAFRQRPPLLDADKDKKIIQTVARLADIGAMFHPDHRADLAYSQVLRAPVPGQNHIERAFIATAIFARYGGGEKTPEPAITQRILGPDLTHNARALGLAVRLGCDLSARSAPLLRNCSLHLDPSALILSARSVWADLLLGEQTKKRALSLANHLKLPLKIEAL